MNSSTSLLFIFATIIVAPAIVDAICTTTADYCWSCNNNTTNPTTTYKQNLNTLLVSLSSNSQTNYGFLNLSLGIGTNKVNVIALCRGDLAQDQCRTCYGEANIILSQNCSNHHKAIIWALGCTVRYSNITMFGIEEDEPAQWLQSPNSATNPEDFKLVLNPLLETLSQNASPGDSTKKFAAGHALVPAGSEANQTIYATAQCSPDLDEQNCSECLEDSIKNIPTCCEGRDGGRVLKPSCTLRFESGIFYDPSADSLINVSTATPPPTATPSPIESSPTTTAGSISLSSNPWIIGMPAGVFGTILLIVCCISRKRILGFFKKDERDEFDIEAFIRNHGSLGPKRYHYSDLKKMTNSFKDQIGKGGYGTVYKGKLPNGLAVAVKVLSESKGNGEDFINEVASIGRTSHVNIVTLVGFCYEGEKRALIYEYMRNGSLDKFIHYKQGSSDESCRLEWKRLSEIAVGVARGLEYLHRGCNTRILHFDIKPQNILLDKDFCPKISDFGLAKLCMTKESIVSMLGTRGTAGYIAPEVFSRNFGGVSHKSDVYSYGMLVLEMVGARKNLDSEMSHTSEMFPHYIYKDLELEKNEIIFGEITEDESKIARKMILISLACIQTLPSDRPSMSKVVEMLEGPLHSLPIPPKPLLFSEEESAPISQPSETG